MRRTGTPTKSPLTNTIYENVRGRNQWNEYHHGSRQAAVPEACEVYVMREAYDHTEHKNYSIALLTKKP